MGNACGGTAYPAEGHTLVTCGPVIGKVTDTTALVMLEVDEAAMITCYAKPMPPNGQPVVTAQCFFTPLVPGVFQLKGLSPNSAYSLDFSVLAGPQSKEIERRGCVVRTLPVLSQLRRLRLIALSCDRPSRMLDKEVNPWSQLAQICKDGQCDIMLHLGDQVYTSENGCLEAAIREMQHIGEPGIPGSLKLKMEKNATARLQESYRHTWDHESTAATLSHSSHLMIWSDNDVTNDFTVARKADGTQLHSPEYMRVAMHVYRMYQRSLWDWDFSSRSGFEAKPAVEEWHFHTYGQCGIFFIDMRGNRISPEGKLYPGLPPVLNAKQKAAMEAAFATPGITCMLMCAEIPFIGDDPISIRKKAEKITFLKDHWPYEIQDLLWILERCFEFKAKAPGREVLMLAGDIHVGVDSEIMDAKTGLKIRHIVTSPITNHVCKFFPALQGKLNDRFSYTHKLLPPEMRNYCKIDLGFEGGAVKMDVEIALVKGHEKIGED